MATFPVLSTGAVGQYPMARGVSYNVEVIRFMDGSDQRYLTRGKPLRRWLIKLDQLTERNCDWSSFSTARRGTLSHLISPIRSAGRLFRTAGLRILTC